MACMYMLVTNWKKCTQRELGALKKILVCDQTKKKMTFIYEYNVDLVDNWKKREKNREGEREKVLL